AVALVSRTPARRGLAINRPGFLLSDMKVLFVTERLPYGSNEAFLTPELREFLRSGQELVIVPLVSGGSSTHADARFLHEHVRTVRLRRPRVLARVAVELV